MNKLSGMLLAVLLLAVANVWGACDITLAGPATAISSPVSAATCNSGLSVSCRNACTGGTFTFNCTGSGRTEVPTYCETTTMNCGFSPFMIQYRVYGCSTQCEADSLHCVNDGGTWTNTEASTCDGKSCKMSNCLQSDTLWLNDSKAACDAIGGENNYAITDIDETCVHSGICCSPDSAIVGNTCKWRCDSLYTACTAKNGYLYAGVLQDTTISGADSTFTNKCYYNCSYAYNKDSTTSVTDGNTACSSPSTPIADCTRMPNDFSSVRTTYGDSVYSYDFLTPGSAAYIDSIVLTPCSRFMYRCTVNGKYKYWYSDADIPTGCTNIVKIK